MTSTAQVLQQATAAGPSFLDQLKQLHFIAHWIFGGGVGVALANAGKIWTWAKSASGQQTIADADDILVAALDACKVNGINLNPNTVAEINNAVAQVQKLTAPKPVVVGALALGLLALGMSAQAAPMNLNLSPTAGTFLMTVAPVASATFYRGQANYQLSPEQDALLGLEVCGNWGPYYLGIVGSLDTHNADDWAFVGGAVGVTDMMGFIVGKRLGPGDTLIGVQIPLPSLSL